MDHALPRDRAGYRGGAFAAGGKLLTCGCGGSAADASHIAGELVKGFELPHGLPGALAQRIERAVVGDLASRLQCGLPCISLAADSAVLTAIVNDIGGDAIFAQQVAALGRPGDVLLGISTSGRTPAVVNAAAVAHALGMKVIGLTGAAGGALASPGDVGGGVPAAGPAEVQQLQAAG